MCGIVGYVTRQSAVSWGPGFLRAATATLANRGPDGEGHWNDQHCGLGHRRLSIIDLASGSQPMSYRDGRFWISFNGEIYNYRELRGELQQKGHVFRTSSDTEVILAAYAEWGAAAPERLRGIFAFAIWDRHTRRLFACRDHLGVKPFFYASGGGWFVFGSQLKSLLIAPVVNAGPSLDACAEYLSLGYTLGDNTIIGSIKRLAPAHCLVVDDGGPVATRRYWDLASFFPPETEAPPAHAGLVEEFAERLDHAVRRQMVSDVPVGGFLSGGIDSSAVVFSMSRDRPEGSISTFSMGFKEPTFSELDPARLVASALGTDHHAEVFSADLSAELPGWVRLFDEPLGDTSIVSTHLVSRLARRHVKVVLSGDGADECLAGYDTYVADRLQRLYRRVPAWLHKGVVSRLARRVPTTERKVGLDYKVRQFAAHAHQSPERAHYGWRLLFDERDREQLLGTESTRDPFQGFLEHFDRAAHAHPLDQALYVDVKTWLANDILTKVDRASMAVGLEARVPFLDVDLVEFISGLPLGLKMRGFKRKVVLRKAMAGRLPNSVLSRRKSGFNAPVSVWLRGPLRSMLLDALAGSSSLVDLKASRLGKQVSSHVAGTADHGFRLWSLLSLLVWEREVLNRSKHIQPLETTGVHR